MDAKAWVSDALEALLRELREFGAGYPPDHWQSLRSDLDALLEELEQCRTGEDWERLRQGLLALRARQDELATDEHDDPDEIHPARGGGSFTTRTHPLAYPASLPRQASTFSARGASVHEIAASLRRLLGGGEPVVKPSPITTYPVVEAPEEVAERTVFRLDVIARAQPAGDVAVSLELPRETPGPVDLEVEVELPADGSITARSQLTQSLRVPEHGDSVTLGFHLFAERRGERPITVRFRHEGLERIVLRRHVGVVAPREAAALPPASGVGHTSAPLWGLGGAFAGLCLRVEERGRDHEERYLRVTLEGSSALLTIPVEGTQPISTTTLELLVKLCRDMDLALALEPADARELRLESIGAELSRALLPEPIRRALSTAPEGTALHVEAEDAWVPWEILWLSGAGFLGERFALTRWLRRGSLRDHLPGGRAILVAPSGSGLSVHAERTALHAVSGAPPKEIGRVADVQAVLATADALGFVHFACHGRTPPGEPLGGMLKLEGGSLRHADVRDPSLHDGAAPLAGACVFLNACETAIAERAVSGHGGWAEVLIRAQAGAVIAPSWSVQDRTATVFAQGFYELVRTGETLGEAARRTRVAVRRTGDPDRIAYAVYAAPAARLVARLVTRLVAAAPPGP